MSELNRFDRMLADDGPAALVIREHLLPVEGEDGVIFPATFAGGEGSQGGYNIDGELNGSNVCLIDSVGSQANRVEPLFANEKYSALVPQIVIKAGEKEVNLLEAGPNSKKRSSWHSSPFRMAMPRPWPRSLPRPWSSVSGTHEIPRPNCHA